MSQYFHEKIYFLKAKRLCVTKAAFAASLSMSAYVSVRGGGTVTARSWLISASNILSLTTLTTSVIKELAYSETYNNNSHEVLNNKIIIIMQPDQKNKEQNYSRLVSDAWKPKNVNHKMKPATHDNSDLD